MANYFLPSIGQVHMEQVVLPGKKKEMWLRTIDNFGNFRKYRKSVGLEDIMTYRGGLVILICWPLGTEKTMTVNFVANHLGATYSRDYLLLN